MKLYCGCAWKKDNPVQKKIIQGDDVREIVIWVGKGAGQGYPL